MKYFYRPVNPFFINQKFGENKACINSLKNIITCDGLNPPPGYKSLYGPVGHKGLDLKCGHGQEVYCVQKGIVDFIDTKEKSGLDVRIITKIGGRTFKHVYEHLLGYQHKIGDLVLTGQLIGWGDNTGYSSANHLHFQLEELINGQWIPIDPLPLMEDKFAKNILFINNSIKYLFEQVALLNDRVADWLRNR